MSKFRLDEVDHQILDMLIDNTRVPFRGWSFAGASLYHTKEITLSGSGNTYTFNDPNRINFSGYRYLRVNAQSATASPESAYLWISYGNSGTYVMSAPMTIPVIASNQNNVSVVYTGLFQIFDNLANVSTLNKDSAKDNKPSINQDPKLPKETATVTKKLITGETAPTKK